MVCSVMRGPNNILELWKRGLKKAKFAEIVAAIRVRNDDGFENGLFSKDGNSLA